MRVHHDVFVLLLGSLQTQLVIDISVLFWWSSFNALFSVESLKRTTPVSWNNLFLRRKKLSLWG
jgi:hypothetical protein